MCIMPLHNHTGTQLDLRCELVYPFHELHQNPILVSHILACGICFGHAKTTSLYCSGLFIIILDRTRNTPKMYSLYCNLTSTSQGGARGRGGSGRHAAAELIQVEGVQPVTNQDVLPIRVHVSLSLHRSAINDLRSVGLLHACRSSALIPVLRLVGVVGVGPTHAALRLIDCKPHLVNQGVHKHGVLLKEGCLSHHCLISLIRGLKIFRMISDTSFKCCDDLEHTFENCCRKAL